MTRQILKESDDTSKLIKIFLFFLNIYIYIHILSLNLFKKLFMLLLKIYFVYYLIWHCFKIWTIKFIALNFITIWPLIYGLGWVNDPTTGCEHRTLLHPSQAHQQLTSSVWFHIPAFLYTPSFTFFSIQTHSTIQISYPKFFFFSIVLPLPRKRRWSRRRCWRRRRWRRKHSKAPTCSCRETSCRRKCSTRCTMLLKITVLNSTSAAIPPVTAPTITTSLLPVNT